MKKQVSLLRISISHSQNNSLWVKLESWANLLNIANRFYACGLFRSGQIHNHVSEAFIMKLNGAVAINNFLILEPNINGQKSVKDMQCAFSKGSDKLVHYMITDSGYIITSSIKLSNFTNLSTAYGMDFD